MSQTMTRAVRDDLAKLAYGLCRGLNKRDRDSLMCSLSLYGPIEFDQEEAQKLYRRGKDLVRREKGRAA